MRKIKYLVMDVDGTLTDGKIYMGQEGELAKAFDIKDGAGISLILPELNITPVIITARESQILQKRCRELNITELHQGVKDKLGKLKEIVGEDLSSVAYAGDDLPDIPCMENVQKAGGVVLAPADAIPQIKVLAEYISGCKAGHGAIRDCIAYLAQRDNQDNIAEKVKKTIEWILKKKYIEEAPPDGCSYTIQEYITKPESDCVLESHRRHIDIQYMLEGREVFKNYSIKFMASTGRYSKDKDIEYWQEGLESSYCILVPGSLVVVYANQPHKGAIALGKAEKVKKIVCKIEVNHRLRLQ